eukprot:scaffold28657_cov19-Tisochrysis_lutea.AAC.4
MQQMQLSNPEQQFSKGCWQLEKLELTLCGIAMPAEAPPPQILGIPHLVRSHCVSKVRFQKAGRKCAHQAHPPQELGLEAQLVGLEEEHGGVGGGRGLPQENKGRGQQDVLTRDCPPKRLHPIQQLGHLSKSVKQCVDKHHYISVRRAGLQVAVPAHNSLPTCPPSCPAPVLSWHLVGSKAHRQ